MKNLLSLMYESREEIIKMEQISKAKPEIVVPFLLSPLD